jgi:RNA polymerase sigma-70 factor (ECF subfamily)
LFVQRRYGACEKGPIVSHAHGTAHQGVTAEQDAGTGLEARLAAGAEGVIDDVYAAHGSAVLGYLRSFVPRDDAEDVLQRVFYEVWRHQRRYDPSRSLAAWVFGIARNRAIDHLRRQRGTSVPLEGLGDLAGEDGRDVAEQYVRGNEVRSALSRLPNEQRKVLTLAYFGGYSQSEIAARLELPLGTVKASTFRGLRRMAASLAPERGQCRAPSPSPRQHPGLVREDAPSAS